MLAQIRSGKMQSDMARILHHIKSHPYTTLPEIERKLGLLNQTASPRISDLLDLGLIEGAGETKQGHGHYTYFKFQPDLGAQKRNAMERKKTKFEHWKKKGLSQFKDFIDSNLINGLSCEK